MSAPRILVVEDEKHLAEGLLFNLQAEGYNVAHAPDGERALALLQSEHFDAALLDVMLPGKSGFEVAAELRRSQNYLPLLMLTARSRPEDVLQGFAAGADDYLPKPFDLSILLARLNGLLRRMKWHSAARPESTPDDLPHFEFAGRRIDFENLRLEALGKEVHLTLMEADLLRYLVRNQGRSVSRKELLEQVWRLREDTDTRAIDNFIVRLRRYIEDEPSSPRYLRTVRGIGYSFVPSGE
ncbi:MAG TPA: response regulator transcription factor [Acidobacteriaceae bacterium]|jgi:DNA-binding response OmpR family regulator|nr:response regulator transcription factor [Acidobacteriaceae bacterium]